MTLPAWRNKFGVLPLRLLRRVLHFIGACVSAGLERIPYFRFLHAYRGAQGAIDLRTWFFQKIVGINRDVYWGVHFTSKIVQHKKIIVGEHTNPGIEPGCYVQGLGGIFFGDYTNIASNCTFVSANHDVYDGRRHVRKSISIGSYCWFGANCVVLPGVELGDFTIVGAGSVVTKSFPEGYCVIAGNPARLVKWLDPDRCIRYRSDCPYVGYIPVNDFVDYREKFLWI